MRKYDTINWQPIQDAHDKGMGWKDIIQTMPITNAALAWARKNGKLQFRNKSESQKLAWKNGKQKAERYRTIEFRKKMSKWGGYKENAGRCAHLIYTKKDGTLVKIQGSWELKVAQFLDEKKIKWAKNKLGYKYFFDGKERSYFPDFVIEDMDVYIEVKGYETSKDTSKWKQFPKKLLVIRRNDIKDLEFWFKNNLQGSKL
jgi:hypothetical protein